MKIGKEEEKKLTQRRGETQRYAEIVGSIAGLGGEDGFGAVFFDAAPAYGAAADRFFH